jgi:hypothetical protein
MNPAFLRDPPLNPTVRPTLFPRVRGKLCRLKHRID